MQNTINYNLKKPERLIDFFTVENENDNMDIIDAALKANADAVVSKVSKLSGTGTITTTGWVANAGDYPLKLDLAVTGILSTDSVDVFVDNNNQDTAQDAELSPNNDSYNGGITFYCKTMPTATIGFSYRGLR